LRAPYWRMYYSAQMNAAIREELARSRYDLVHVDTGFVAMHAGAITGVPKLLAAHDSLTAVRFSAVRHARGPREFAARLWTALLVRRYEKTYYRQYDGCVVVAEPDAAVVRRLCPRLPVWLVPSGVDTEFFVPRPELEGENELVFTGTMDYGPNVDAVVHFVRSILPRIRQRVAGVRFSIVGRNPTEAVRALKAEPGVTVTGPVADLRPHVWQATLYVCPLRQGAGMKNKMLEALAMGKAIVATRSAASGLAVRDGRELLLRDGDEAFAQAVVGLLQDRAARARLGAAGREHALACYSWQNTARAMEEAYRNTVALHKTVAPAVAPGALR
jgi:glycosyltransferase involved in cell wall biosynthesis